MPFRSDSLQVQLNDLGNEDCNMKSFLREIESKLCALEKNQQAILKLLQSSTDKEENSKNSAEVRGNDLSVRGKKFLIEKRGPVAMCANINRSDDKEIKKLHYMDELPEMPNVYQITQGYARKRLF